MRFRSFVAALALLCSTADVAQATSITFTDADIAGLSITLENQGLISGTTYDLLVTVSTDAGYVNQGDGALSDILTTLSFDLSSSATDAALISFNTGAGTAWTVFDGNQQNSGNGSCTTAESGATCLQEVFSNATSAGNMVLAPSQSYTWDLQLDLLGGSFSSITSVKAFIADLELVCTGPSHNQRCEWKTKKADVFEASATQSLSRPPSVGGPTDPGNGPDVTPVPEPGSLILLGSGLLFAANCMRRR